ncbi:hypothetical protein MMC06_005109 [Schaereria dolodes]|nr:hypothetical protein [Schaereria dolodes]
MLSLRKLLTSTLFLTQIAALVITEPPCKTEDDRGATADLKKFQALLDQVDPPSLHAALHDFDPKKFKHGVFQEDRTAVEAVHRDNAPLATKIISLARRQASNSTSATNTPVGSIPPSETSSINPSTVAPNPITQPSDTVPATAVPQTDTSTPATSQVSSATPTTLLVTSTLPASSPSSLHLGPGPVSVSSAGSLSSGVVTTGTNAAGIPVITTGSGGAFTLTSGAVVTTTNAAGVTIESTVDGGVITVSGSGEAASSTAATTSAGGSGSETTTAKPESTTAVILHTTTLPDGGQSVVTAVTVVQATGGAEGSTPSGTAGVGSGTETSGGSPGLQTGLAPRTRTWGWEVVGVLGGAVGFAMVL